MSCNGLSPRSIDSVAMPSTQGMCVTTKSMRTPCWIIVCSAWPSVSSGLAVAARTSVKSVITHSAGDAGVTDLSGRGCACAMQAPSANLKVGSKVDGMANL